MTQIINLCLYTSYTIENIHIDEVDDINIHKQNFVFYSIDCQFEKEFKNNIFAKIEINQHFNSDYINIDSCRYGNFVFDNNIKMEISMTSCRCNLNSPMSMLERRINMVIAKNPQLINLLNNNKNHPLIRKYSHISLQT